MAHVRGLKSNTSVTCASRTPLVEIDYFIFTYLSAHKTGIYIYMHVCVSD